MSGFTAQGNDLLSLKGNSKNWRATIALGKKRYDARVDCYNQEHPEAESLAQTMDTAEVNYWSRQVLLAFAKYLATEAVKEDDDDDQKQFLKEGTVISYFSGFLRALENKYNTDTEGEDASTNEFQSKIT